MMMKVFGIYDTKSACYPGMPFFANMTAAGIRSFGDLANDKQSSVNRHPTDYILFELGEFDTVSGELISNKVPKHLGIASDYIEVQNELPLLTGVDGKNSKVEKMEAK